MCSDIEGELSGVIIVFPVALAKIDVPVLPQGPIDEALIIVDFCTEATVVVVGGVFLDSRDLE